MEVDSLKIVDTTAHWSGPVYTDSTIALAKQWIYSRDSALYHGSGFWFQEVLQYFKQRDNFGIERHQGIQRPNKMVSESILLTLLLFEVFLVAFLLKRGLKLIAQYTKINLGSENRTASTNDSVQSGGFNLFLWLLTLVVFALMGHVLLNAKLGHQGFELDSYILFRLFLFTVAFFMLQGMLYQLLGKIFFTPQQTSRWIANNKTVLFFYAMVLSPVLIGAEIGAITNGTFIFYWTLVFLFVARVWMFSKTVQIFSIGKGFFFYLILYLCALEILPILLFYRGLFLL
ncbi:MAG TPA: DUF4271 domain-containing protein [Bacteroidales bacterium]|nr:DUF4271 domain-containing protein [Bacteroidales bacterium]